MSEKQPALSKGFHGFLIYFALWAFALLGILFGARWSYRAVENGMEHAALFVVLGCLLIAAALFTVKVRFDLAAFRAKAPGELRLVCFAAAAVIAARCLLLYLVAEDVVSRDWFPAVIFALWGATLYRYYHDRAYLFKN